MQRAVRVQGVSQNPNHFGYRIGAMGSSELLPCVGLGFLNPRRQIFLEQSVLAVIEFGIGADNADNWWRVDPTRSSQIGADFRFKADFVVDWWHMGGLQKNPDKDGEPNQAS